jgi:hypothetical protein
MIAIAMEMKLDAERNTKVVLSERAYLVHVSILTSLYPLHAIRLTSVLLLFVIQLCATT